MSGNYQGAVSGLTGYLLHGWVWNPAAPDERVVVEVYLDGLSLGVITANVFETDLYDQDVGDGVHGFSYVLANAALEQGGKLQVRVANSEAWLQPALDLGQCEHTGKLDSQVFTDGGLRLTGWARELAGTDQPLTIHVSCEDGLHTQVVAKNFNMHAAAQNKCCGFDISLPLALADGRAHKINLLTDAGEHLKGSPVTIACHPEGDAGYFQSQLADRLESDATARQFAELLHENRHYTPRSVSPQQYARWFDLFAAPRHALRKRRVEFVIRWVGKGDKARSRASLARQSYKSVSEKKGGKYVALLGCGDTLPDWAFAAVADGLGDKTGILFTDCDQDDENGARSEPWFKPAWDADLFCQQNILAPLCVIAADIVKKFPAAAPETLPYLAAAYCLQEGRAIQHLPLVCYHRAHQASSWEHAASAADFQASLGWNAALRETPLVSVIIPSRDQVQYLKTCVTSVRFCTYKPIEIIVVDNQSVEAETLQYLAELKSRGVTVLNYSQPFNYSAINNMAVAQAKGDVICLLNNDVEVLTPNWLENMLSVLQRDDVGVVGAKLLWRNRMVQHAGVVLGLNKVAGHCGIGWADDDAGYQGLNQQQRQVAAVTGACLLIRKRDYEAVGGLNAVDFPVAFNDVDLCLKVTQQLGKSVVWTPHAKLYHDESASRGKEDSPQKQARSLREIAALRRHWGDHLLNDRAYNPNLNLDALAGPYNGLALPPRPRRAR